PTEFGSYAVVVFQHGFLLANSFYSEMLRHLSSHGFVVVAPQMYEPGGLPIGQPTSHAEAVRAIEVLDWLPGKLNTITGVTADTDTLGLAGHSRGGKVVWLILSQDSSRALAVAGVEPVDSGGAEVCCEERVIQGPFPFQLPTLVIGAGLDYQSILPCLSGCLPAGYNHQQFYDASNSPAWHVVAVNQGHMDMLNDRLDGCGLMCLVCPVGPERAGMRQLTAGLLAAFFRGSLQGDAIAYHYLTDTTTAPIIIEVEYR
ncbi:MAG: dienelactone hydrolase family protein, partial [Planctomycetota bacterium]